MVITQHINTRLSFFHLFAYPGYTSLQKITQLNKLKTASLLKIHLLDESQVKEEVLANVQLILEAKERMIEKYRFKTWLQNNNIEHMQAMFEEKNINTLYDVRDHLEELRTSEFADAFRALVVFEIKNRDSSLEEFDVFYKRSVLVKLSIAMLRTLILLGSFLLLFLEIYNCWDAAKFLLSSLNRLSVRAFFWAFLFQNYLKI